MRRTISSVVLGVLLLLALPAARSEAWVRAGPWHHWGGPRVIVGPVFGWGFYGPPPPYYVYTPPPVVVVPPPVYVQPPTASADGYWYYCQSANAYYPRVPSCKEPWVRVPPTPQ